MALQAQPPQTVFNCTLLPLKHLPSSFSSTRVLEYLKAIDFKPLPVWRGETRWDNFEPDLKTLEILMRLHIIAFPHENTEDHYTERGRICWKVHDVFARIVTEKKGYGTICFGHAFVFKEILRSLGYRAIATPTRYNTSWHKSFGMPDLAPLRHTVLLVTIPGHSSPFLVDVGFGSTNRMSFLLKPLPLIPGVVTGSLNPPEECRLIQGDRTASSIEPKPFGPCGWWLEARYSANTAWNAILYFTLDEYAEKDFDYLAWGAATMPEGPNGRLCCIKVIEGPDGTLTRYTIAGKVAMKQIGSGEQVVVQKFRWEEERLDAIQRLCRIQLDAAEALKHMAKKNIALPIQKPSRL